MINDNVKFLRKIIAKMPGHIYWKDKNGVIQGCNIGQAESLGFKNQDELVGKTLSFFTK